MVELMNVKGRHNYSIYLQRLQDMDQEMDNV